MEELNFEQMESTQGGKFWGSDSGCHGCDETGHKTCWSTYYVFWISTGYDYSYVQC
jgi:hypothetical protein